MIKTVDLNYSFTRKELLKWIKSGESSDNFINKYLKHGSTAPREAWPEKESIEPSKDFLCPKADKCIMDCYHRKPHAYEEKFCNDLSGECGIQCVHELISDCTFFDEDFHIE